MRDERRVSAYIDEMTCTPFGPSLVAGWNNDLKNMKHYRHIRNLIAHEPDCSEDSLCVPSDAVWIENFCTRILNSSDPLSLTGVHWQSSAKLRRKASRSRRISILKMQFAQMKTSTNLRQIKTTAAKLQNMQPYLPLQRY